MSWIGVAPLDINQAHQGCGIDNATGIAERARP
jgi:hypothetical protein